MAKFEVLNKVSTASVHKGTGRGWDEWVRLLNKAGAKNWTHQETVAFLKKKYKLTPWWQQGVTVGFEIAVGRRQEGQNLKGEFGVMASRTFPLGVKALWKFVTSDRGIALWLKPMGDFELKPKQQFEVEGGIFGEVRTMKTFERARLTWREEEWARATVLNLMFLPRTESKSILVFQHDRLFSARQREEMRSYWKARIEELLKDAL
ncbi:MAG: hypothetical protein KF799_14555 [Bdellovibrionales bacterium]|nr:hypothetical protein [Bdellovibrionales bacterium]